MILNGLPIENWSERELLALLENPDFRESDSLDYKQEFEINEEFKKDVCSFANNRGGVLFYGIAEKLDEQNNKTGMAGEIVGIENAGADEFERKIGNSLSSSVEPVKPLFTLNAISVGDGSRCVLALQISEGYEKPYCPKQSRQFFIRGNANKEPMTYFQIQELFLQNSASLAALSQFIESRANFLRNPNNPQYIGYESSPRFSFYLVPLSALAGGARQYPISALMKDQEAQLMQSIDASGFPWEQAQHGALNVDGAIFYRQTNKKNDRAHIQLFRSGAIELSTNSVVNPARPCSYTELSRAILSALALGGEILNMVRSNEPVAAAFAFDNVRESKFYTGKRKLVTPFDRSSYRSTGIKMIALAEDTRLRTYGELLNELGYMVGDGDFRAQFLDITL